MQESKDQNTYSNKLLSQLVIAQCKAYGITDVIISPGSRNAPLTLGFTGNDFFNCKSVVDERCAAFFALGMAQQKGAPVALVCTSGSAMLNYFPAVAEAFYSDVPLVVLSADRPPELLEIGDGQTIQQENAYGSHILYSANCKPENEALNANKELIATALKKAWLEQGPVHINLPFAEPLYKITLDSVYNFPAVELPKPIEFAGLNEEQEQTFKAAKRIIVLVGVLEPESIEEQLLDTFLNDARVLLLTETTSNLNHTKAINSIDQLIFKLTEDEFKALQPDLLITFGGMIVSKKIKAFLRRYKPVQHWHVDPKKAYDTYFCLSNHFKTKPQEFLGKLPELGNNPSSYQDDWFAVRAHRRAKHQEYLQQIPFSDFMAYAELFNALPEQSQLQLSNSAAIRYAQLFTLKRSLSIFCNRGTSGIDGSTSTAIGAAVASKNQTVFVTGDLSFYYDSNALWNKYVPANFRIILINNSGGGIFRILPGDKSHSNFEDYFETTHNLNASYLCAMYHWSYHSADSKESLKSELETFFNDRGQPALLEITTPRTVNDKVLLDYFEFTK